MNIMYVHLHIVIITWHFFLIKDTHSKCKYVDFQLLPIKFDYQNRQTVFISMKLELSKLSFVLFRNKYWYSSKWLSKPEITYKSQKETPQ